jgi:ribonuclease I
MRTTAVDDDDNVLSSRPMKPAILIGVLALPVLFVACKSTPRNTPASESAPPAKRAALPIGSGFDYYLLNLSWSPEFCYSHPDAAECASHFTFVLHGLWPQNNDGTYPENCSNAPGPTDPSAFKDIYPDPGLLEHEWRAHGTCSGLDAGAFFTTARTAVHSMRSHLNSPASQHKHRCPLPKSSRSLRAPIRQSLATASPSAAAIISSPRSKSASTKPCTPSHAVPSAPAVPTPSASRPHAKGGPKISGPGHFS